MERKIAQKKEELKQKQEAKRLKRERIELENVLLRCQLQDLEHKKNMKERRKLEKELAACHAEKKEYEGYLKNNKKLEEFSSLLVFDCFLVFLNCCVGDKNVEVDPSMSPHNRDGWNEPELFDLTMFSLSPSFDSCFQTLSFEGDELNLYYRMSSRRMRVKKKAFARGAIRLCYFAEDCETKQIWVVKESRTHNPLENSREFFENCIREQWTARKLAAHFIGHKKSAYNLDYLQMHLLVSKTSSTVFTLEPYHKGAWQKYTTNSSRNSPILVPCRTILAFGHFTWQHSRQRLMVADLQGFEQYGYILSDPALQTERKSGATDLGEDSIRSFFQQHRCNQLCVDLQLKRHPKQGFVGEHVNDTCNTTYGICLCGALKGLSGNDYKARQNGREIWCDQCCIRNQTVSEAQCTACNCSFVYCKNKYFVTNANSAWCEECNTKRTPRTPFSLCS